MPSPLSQAQAPLADPARFGAVLGRWLGENTREALISATRPWSCDREAPPGRRLPTSRGP